MTMFTHTITYQKYYIPGNYSHNVGA